MQKKASKFDNGLKTWWENVKKAGIKKKLNQDFFFCSISKILRSIL
jgi:hypothetical protein